MKIKQDVHVLNPVTPPKEIFDARAKEYWDDMDGLIELLNRANPKIQITNSLSPHIMNYLLWRLLFEIKSIKIVEQEHSRLLKLFKNYFNL
ncbi:MAG: hypothetical protein IH948_00715 [Bacteroidetes bacterium]|nr:hypothetical protein [Bacteroidota bacterium]